MTLSLTVGNYLQSRDTKKAILELDSVRFIFRLTILDRLGAPHPPVLIEVWVQDLHDVGQNLMNFVFRLSRSQTARSAVGELVREFREEFNQEPVDFVGPFLLYPVTTAFEHDGLR